MIDKFGNPKCHTAFYNSKNSDSLLHRVTSLRDLVSRKYLHLKKHPLLSGEGNQAKNVLFLFNGMEKMQLDFRIGASELCSDPNEGLPPSVVVVNLLRKYLLPEVRKKTKQVN